MYNTTKEKELFDLFLNKYTVNPNESIFIDDRENILEKANEYGFNLMQMNRKDDNVSNKFRTIHGLKEIN
jgi:FMN phosphatase YigB (HAD superfamily)